MSEVQSHGFIWQTHILKNIFKITDEDLKLISYTSELDLPPELNKINNCVGLSIKTTCNNNVICMSDAIRLYDLVASDKLIYMIVIYYKQIKNTKIIETIYQINLSNSVKILFGSITRDDLCLLQSIIKDVPKNPSKTDRLKYKTLQKLLNSKSGAIYLNPKCDNKNQRRLQCSFNKFQKFIKDDPTLIINQNFIEMIPTTINSSKRILKKH